MKSAIAVMNSFNQDFPKQDTDEVLKRFCVEDEQPVSVDDVKTVIHEMILRATSPFASVNAAIVGFSVQHLIHDNNNAIVQEYTVTPNQLGG